jgi:hypothetical protein
MAKRDAAVLIDRAHPNGVLAVAAFAEPQKPLVALACTASVIL